MGNLLKVRKLHGFTLHDLSEKTGIKINSLWRYEQGKIRPSVDNALKISNALNVPIEELFVNERRKIHENNI